MALHNQYFYHSSTRKYTILIGNMFNSIYVVRYNADGTENKREKVPVAYGPKQKYLYRIEQNPDLNEKSAIKLPRISFELIEMKYDPSRKTPSTNKLRNDTAVDGVKKYQYNPIPFEFIYDVGIMSKNTDEALQMVEQIVPFFTPDYTVTINAIPELNHKLDVPIVMNSINMEDNWDTAFKERRNIIWNLNLTLKGFIYAPTRDSKIILEADWDISSFDGAGVYSRGIETKK